MTLVNFSHSFAQNSLYQNYQLKWQYISKYKINNTIQTKQHAMKKPNSYSNRNKIYKGIFFFFVEGFWAENVQNLKFLLIQKVGNVFNISLFLEVLLFLCVSDIWNRVQIIFFYNSYTFLQRTFGEKLIWF